MGDEVIEAAGAKIFAEKLALVSDQRAENIQPQQTSLKGISLHEAFIARMDLVIENVIGVWAMHLDQQKPLAGGPEAPHVEMLPEVRVFADVMAEQGADSEIYDSLTIIANMVALEEMGKLGYEVAPGEWIRKPALYDKVSASIEGGLKQVAANPELMHKLEWLIENKTLPLIDKLTEESMSLGGVVRHFSDNEEFKDIENLHGKLSAFAKFSYLATVNEWAAQNGLPQLDLNKHLPEEYLVTMKVGGKIPAEQLEFAKEAVAKISPETQTPVDKSAISNADQEQKELATINQR